MKRFLYILVLLFILPSSLLAGKWDGEYKFSSPLSECGQNSRFELNLIVKNNFLVGTLKGKRNGNCRDFQDFAFRTSLNKGKFKTFQEREYSPNFSKTGRHGYFSNSPKTVQSHSDVSGKEITRYSITGDFNLSKVTIETFFQTASNPVNISKGKTIFSQKTSTKKKQTSQIVQTVASSQSGGKWDGVYELLIPQFSNSYTLQGFIWVNPQKYMVSIERNKYVIAYDVQKLAKTTGVVQNNSIKFSFFPNKNYRQPQKKIINLNEKEQKIGVLNRKGEFVLVPIKISKISGPSKTSTRTTQSTSPPDPLSTAFKGLPSKTRKDIQTVLKEKGLYTSSIDGLYGKGTRKAIVGFFKDKGVGDDLDKLDLRKELRIIANINLIKEKEEQERLRKEKEIADKKEQERLQAEKLAKEQKDKEEREKKQARLEKEKKEREEKEAAKLEREKKEEEKRIAEEQAFTEKVNAYKEESSDLINDIKKYITNNDDFDVIQLGELFVNVEKLSKSGWGQKTVQAYENLRTFVFSSEDFKTYYDEQVKERLNTYQNNLATIKEDLNDQLPVIKKFIANNLGSEKVGQAIELGKIIKEQVVSDSLESLENLKGTVDKWLKENDLFQSETIENPSKKKSEEKKVVDTATTKKVSVKINVKSFDLVKEVGDGFDNYEATKNMFLLPLIIDIQSSSKNAEKKLTFELALEGMVPIYPDVEASEAFGAQEGIDYFDGNLSLKSKKNIGMVFVIPIQGINKEEGTVSLFVDKQLSKETKVKISK